ncbi:MAG: hypothetical protein B7X53_00300 [Hyphomonas sp. 34-62-18]|nr:MAG: hypothetical protein B7X53_00300 [Hyphomonas sp. 34-62-18]
MQLSAVIPRVALGMMVLVEITDACMVAMRVMFMSVIFVQVNFESGRDLRMRHSVRCRDKRTRHRQHNAKESYPELAHTAR